MRVGEICSRPVIYCEATAATVGRKARAAETRLRG